MAADNTHQTPRVFISSTVKDLAEHRRAAERAAKKAGFLAQLSEDWEASPTPPLNNCLERVDHCHLVVVLVADWHGWTPDDVTNAKFKSITRLECEQAVANGYDIIPFLLDPDFKDWPPDIGNPIGHRSLPFAVGWITNITREANSRLINKSACPSNGSGSRRRRAGSRSASTHGDLDGNRRD